ncbi:glycosyltransferase [Thermoleptolyngbya sichuanensis A183]|uniref:Glycosyltransferase n=1 Tax=Thermoleptolyngbya sichuanensis A183 TaxID=2737172 RepID=A0A6M8BD46_9CYAN|nr:MULTISPECIES: glycosyltransferase [Thermoleptolyngbya]QKD81541.1 glycosyltransferase [Thermoleptolyngbya sichuanensis A183]
MKPEAEQRLHCWVPNLFEFQGGIQRYLQDLLRAIASQPYCHTIVFNKRDRAGNGDLDKLSNLTFRYFGALPDAAKTPGFAASLMTAALGDRPDLILCGHLHFAPVALMLRRLAGIPYWIFTYGIDAWNVQNPLQKAALHAADRIVSISGYTRDRLLREQQLDPARVALLPCTIDAQRFRPAPKPDYLLQRYGLQPDQPVVLTVARLVGGDRHKGYEAVLSALPLVRRVLPQVHYVLVGKGGDRPRIEARIAELGLQDCVTLAGFVPDAELCDHYNLCDVFAMPSQGEGFGIVYLEAIACGKPALGGNQDGATDALAQGELGALVDPTDHEAIARTLIQILQGAYPNPLLYQPAELRRRAIARYGRDTFNQTLNQLLTQAS